MRRDYVRSMVLGLACLGSGCLAPVSSVTGEAMPLRSAEFRAYAERVFREQNAQVSALALLIDAALAAGEDIDAAEQQEAALLDACALLNAAAARNRDNSGNRRVFADLATARSVPGCEAATVQVRGWLERAQRN